jgi:hypothetical protein
MFNTYLKKGDNINVNDFEAFEALEGAAHEGRLGDEACRGAEAYNGTNGTNGRPVSDVSKHNSERGEAIGAKDLCVESRGGCGAAEACAGAQPAEAAGGD